LCQSTTAFVSSALCDASAVSMKKDAMVNSS
jgi:hypothetical protein